MKTLHVDLGQDWRGGQGQALLLMQGLKALGHTAELVGIERSPLAEKARAAGIPTHTVSGSHARLAASLRLWSLAAEVVHCHDAHSLTAAWMGGVPRRAKLVASRRLAYPLARGWAGLARYRSAYKIVAVSEFVRASVLASGLPPGQVVVVHDGVPLPARTTPEERAAARGRWTEAVEEPLIGCVGYLLPEKGQELAVRAMPLLRGRGARSRLVLAGDGPTRARLEQLAGELGVAQRVLFAGHVDEVEQVYRALDVFIFPSLAEPLGSSLLAAMSYALPVVGVASGAVPEIVDHGRNGLLAALPDPNELARAVETMLEEPAKAARMGEAARATVEERFSASRMVESTLAVYAAP